MLNELINNEIAEILEELKVSKEIKDFGNVWSTDYEKMPYAFFDVVSNSADIITESGEDTSRIQVAIHIFAKTRIKADEILSKINAKLNDNYWYRTNYRHDAEGDRSHSQATFIVKVDIHSFEHFNALA